MAKLRFRVELNKGGIGVTMSKLASVITETEKFLQMLISDIAIEDTSGKWIAKDFDNNSVDFNNDYVGQVTIPEETHFNEALDFITAETIEIHNKPARVSPAVILQYSKIATSIDEDEAITFGLFNGKNDDVKEYRSLSKVHALEIQQLLKMDDRVQYLGTVQGTIHSIITQGKNASFRIRELYSGNLITCYYDKSQYIEIVSVLKKRGAVVHIEGWITASRSEHKALRLEILRIEPAVEYQEGDLDEFIGLLADDPNNLDDIV